MKRYFFDVVSGKDWIPITTSKKYRFMDSHIE